MKNPIRTILSTLILTTALSAAVTASAATDGTLGSTSTGSVGISLTGVAAPASQIQISGLQDIDFGNVNVGTTPLPKTISNICVYLTTAATYAISFSPGNADSGPNSGVLVDGNIIPGVGYTISFTDNTGSTTTQFSGNAGFVGSSTSGCTSGAKASLTITPGNVNRTDPNPFTSSLTLTVSPE